MNVWRALMFSWLAVILMPPHAFGQSAREYFQRGMRAYTDGNFQVSIYDFSKAIEVDPALGIAYNNRGVVLARAGNMQRAIDDFTMAIATNAKDAEAYNNRGRAYTSMGNLQQAVEDFSKAIAVDSLYLKAYKNRGSVYLDLKQYNRAWSDLFKVEELGGTVDHEFYEDLKRATASVMNSEVVGQ